MLEYYWSLVFHKKETKIHDYIVYLFKTQEEAIQRIKERQIECGKTLTEPEIYHLVEAETPISLDKDTVVSLSKVRVPS
jgi:hypothetical protein